MRVNAGKWIKNVTPDAVFGETKEEAALIAELTARQERELRAQFGELVAAHQERQARLRTYLGQVAPGAWRQYETEMQTIRRSDLDDAVKTEKMLRLGRTYRNLLSQAFLDSDLDLAAVAADLSSSAHPIPGLQALHTARRFFRQGVQGAFVQGGDWFSPWSLMSDDPDEPPTPRYDDEVFLPPYPGGYLVGAGSFVDPTKGFIGTVSSLGPPLIGAAPLLSHAGIHLELGFATDGRPFRVLAEIEVVNAEASGWVAGGVIMSRAAIALNLWGPEMTSRDTRTVYSYNHSCGFVGWNYLSLPQELGLSLPKTYTLAADFRSNASSPTNVLVSASTSVQMNAISGGGQCSQRLFIRRLIVRRL